MYIKFFLLVEIGFVFEFCWIITLLWRKFFISGYTCISFIFFFILNKWIYYSKTRFVELRDCYVPLAKWMSKVKLGLTFKLKYEVRSFIQIIQNILLVPFLTSHHASFKLDIYWSLATQRNFLFHSGFILSTHSFR